MHLILALVLVLSAFLPNRPAAAQELRIGVQADPSLDPHFLYIGTNVAIWRHMFGSLTIPGPRATIEAGIAESYRLVDPLTWEFKLRPDIRLTDGSVLTADDVVFSLARIPNVPRNPSTYAVRMDQWQGVEAVDPLTVRIRTAQPNPFLPEAMIDLAIVSRKATEGRATSDFTSGAAMATYGPYRFVSYAPGDRLIVERNETYAGPKPYWQRVTFRVLGNDAARVAALLTGEVDFIEFVPPSDIPTLRGNPAVALHDGPTGRVICFLFDFHDGPLAGLRDLAGKPLARNPLQDVRVRRALSKAVDRDAIVSRIMDGTATAANQMASPGMEGFDPSRPAAKADPEGARALLTEAGYPGGFAMTIGCSNNRYPNDYKICQAIGQMFTRIGVRTDIDTTPMSIFMTKLRAMGTATAALPMGMLGLGSFSYPGAPQYMAHSTEAGRGGYNFGGFRDPVLDRQIDAALTTIDAPARRKLLGAVVGRIADDVIVLPIHFQKFVTAARRGIAYNANQREETLAWEIKPQ